MEPGVLVWFPDTAASLLHLIAAKTPLRDMWQLGLCFKKFINMFLVFDLPIDFPYFSVGAFCMDLSPLEKETLSDLRYQNLRTQTNAMPASGS